MEAPNGTEIVPAHLPGRPGPDSPGVIVDNRTGLPDAEVVAAIQSHWVESAALQFGAPSSFQLYATNQGSMLAREPFKTPGNVMEEIKLARQVADADDDIRSTIGQMIADAYGEGMENLHEDERTLALFNKIAGNDALNLDHLNRELYREWLITGGVTTVSLYERRRLSFRPGDGDQEVTQQLQVPRCGILPAEHIRVITNDILNTGALAYKVEGNEALENWLREFFNPTTTPARKAEMAREEPVAAALFVERIQVDWRDADLFVRGQTLYRLNPRMVHRTTMERGASPYPRPPLTANFPLLEAKRLLNIMDYSLLQGGTNYIVIAKVGSDARPAQQPEVDNLTEQVRVASRSGVLVGDHRISVDIVTPELTELLNPGKRKLLGRKLAMTLLRVPEQVTPEGGNEGIRAELEMAARVISADRRILKRHVEGSIYEETANRNPSVFRRGAPKLWFPKLILAGTKDFMAAVTSARDRGDIPRRWAVEALGYDYDAAVAERKRELERGDDDVMIPGSVPFNASDPNAGGEGRPEGSGPDNGRPGARQANQDPAQRQRRVRPSGGGREAVRAVWDEELGRTLRIGETTAAVLEEYPEHSIGRVTDIEREVATTGRQLQRGPLAIHPVNPGFQVNEVRAVRLEEGLSLIVGESVEGVLIAKAICFREPKWTPAQAEETAVRWGFPVGIEEENALVPSPSPAPTPTPGVEDIFANMVTAMTEAFAGVIKDLPVPSITIQMPDGRTRKVIKRDEQTGQIVEVEEVPADS
jgi:hypothetical protein